MASFEAQHQVWQRVAGETPGRRETGAELIRPALILLAAYRQLGAQQLAQEQSDTIACLKGLTRLAGGTVPSPRLPVSGKENNEKLLISCYRQSRAACAEYMARSTDPETGVVFRILSDRQTQHCALIAALLGKNP